MVYAYIVKSAPRSIPISVHNNWLLTWFFFDNARLIHINSHDVAKIHFSLWV